MALETATLISDLVATNPASGDAKSQGDDHLRLIKAVLQAQFPDSANGTIYGVRNGTSQTSTSGTSIDFTSIPSWVKRITVSFVGVSTNGTSLPMVQVGDSGGVETSGYSGAVTNMAAGPAITASSHGAGFTLAATIAAADTVHGAITLTLADAATNAWTASGTFGFGNVSGTSVLGGSKSLSSTLDRVRITTVGGVNTFDAGLVNIQYE